MIKAAVIVAMLTSVPAISAATADDGNLAAADLLRDRHRAHFDVCEFAMAAMLARQELETLTKRPAAPARIAATTSDLARSLVWLMRPAEADSLYRRAIATLRQVDGENALLAETLGRYGLFLADRGFNEEAEVLVVEAHEIASSTFGAASLEAAARLSELGTARKKAMQLQIAEGNLREALTLQRTLGAEEIDVALTMASLAGALIGLEKNAEALSLGTTAIEILERHRGRQHLDTAAALDVLATVNFTTRVLPTSLKLFQECLEIKSSILGPNHPDVAAEINNVAVTLMVMRRFDEAEPLLRKALDIYWKQYGEANEEVAFQLSQLAINLSEQSRFDEAKPVYNSSLDAYRAIDPKHPDIMWLTSYLGRDAYKQGDYATAERCFNETLRERLNRGEQGGHLATDYRFLADIRVATGDFVGAKEDLLRACAAFDLIRSDQGETVRRATFQKSPYLSLAVTLLEQAETESAWEPLERARGRLLADMIASRHGPIVDAGDSADADYVFPLERIQQALPKHGAIVGWIHFETRRGGEPAYWGYVVRDEGPVHWERLGNPESGSYLDLEKRARAFRDAIASVGQLALAPAADDWPSEEARNLWNGCFEPLAGHLNGVSHLIVVPSWAMSEIPVEVFIDDHGRFLADEYVVSYAPSSTSYAWLVEQGKLQTGRSRNGLLVGDPPFRSSHLDETESYTTNSPPLEVSLLRSVLDGDLDALQALPRLPFSREEVTRISSLFDQARILLGDEATEARIRPLVTNPETGFDVVHIATHALIDAHEWERSCLVMAQVERLRSPESDGVITAREIATEWSLDADLVALSACETGVGQPVFSEGTVGFTYPFFQAGARSMLVSLWRVDDEATSLFMQQFYENWLGRGLRKGAALAQAKSWLRSYADSTGRRRFEHPFYWSAFVLVGNPN